MVGYEDAPPSVAEQRESLRSRIIEAKNKYRIVFVGNFFQGPTGIVASLHRALSSVGHTVFKLDTTLHKTVLDRSSGAKGGYGPVFFRPEGVSKIFDSFDPHAIVFCAGGIVLDETGADFFSSRGIMTIGLTLSDPDVQESVIGHINNFDVHTTNAEFSYQRYLREGHSNTLLMPFGIDRSFILRDVAPAKELRADAICIGHAEGRPDRHAVMVPLSKRVNVKTYGSGWPIEGSEPVSGDRLLQAAKEGSVHVNFPATRAGFTNVKCGVFETIGAGAILATSRFDEMARLFSYESEIVGYEDADDLGDTLERLLENPDEMELIRRRGFRRLIDEHLYEQRWLQVFESIENSLRGNGDLFASKQEQNFRRFLETVDGRPRNIIISGYFGARNRGDDILLEALSRRLKENIPAANVIAASVNQLVVERDQGIQAFKRTDPWASDRYASEATGLILGPGGLWHDYTIQAAGGVAGIFTGATMSPSHMAQLPLMVKAHGGEFHVHGMGVGPLSDNAAKAAIRLTGSLAKSITVRDAESANLLSDIDSEWSAKPVVSPDIAYTLPLPEGLADLADEPTVDDDKYLVVNVRPFKDDLESLESIRDAVFEFASANGLRVIGVPMQPIDEATMTEWASDERVPFEMFPQDETYERFIDVIRSAAAVVSMRLHLNLFAHRLGKNPVGIVYDPKLAGHFAQLGRGEFAVPMPVSSFELSDRLRRVYESPVQTSDTRARIRDLEEQANGALKNLCDSFASADPKLPDSGSMIQEAPKPEKVKAPLTPWPSNENLALNSAVVSARNTLDGDRPVPHLYRVGAAGATFQLDVRAPLAGDTVEWAMKIPYGDAPGSRLELWIKQRYAEKRKFAGRIAYEVAVNGKVLFSQDVTDWQPRNTVWIGCSRPAPGDDTNDSEYFEVVVRLKALRNCENWNWGKATAMTVEAARIQPWTPAGDLVWGSSSPYARNERLLANATPIVEHAGSNESTIAKDETADSADGLDVTTGGSSTEVVQAPAGDSYETGSRSPWWRFW